MVQSATPKKKSTFFLSEDLLAQMKEIVPLKGLRSQNALVETALREYIAGVRREVLKKEYLKASRDPQFLADVDEIEQAFKNADAESARMIP